MEKRAAMRAADSDRRAAAERLGVAMAEGRLDLLEYEARLIQAYSAGTYGELDRLLADLPSTGRRAAWAELSATTRRGQGILAQVPGPLRALWLVWLAVVGAGSTVWLAVGDPGFFWPMALLVPGAALPGVTVGAVAVRRAAGGRSVGAR